MKTEIIGVKGGVHEDILDTVLSEGLLQVDNTNSRHGVPIDQSIGT